MAWKILIFRHYIQLQEKCRIWPDGKTQDQAGAVTGMTNLQELEKPIFQLKCINSRNIALPPQSSGALPHLQLSTIPPHGKQGQVTTRAMGCRYTFGKGQLDTSYLALCPPRPT